MLSSSVSHWAQRLSMLEFIELPPLRLLVADIKAPGVPVCCTTRRSHRQREAYGTFCRHIDARTWLSYGSRQGPWG